jgi:hypothetical protein
MATVPRRITPPQSSASRSFWNCDAPVCVEPSGRKKCKYTALCALQALQALCATGCVEAVRCVEHSTIAGLMLHFAPSVLVPTPAPWEEDSTAWTSVSQSGVVTGPAGFTVTGPHEIRLSMAEPHV